MRITTTTTAVEVAAAATTTTAQHFPSKLCYRNRKLCRWEKQQIKQKIIIFMKQGSSNKKKSNRKNENQENVEWKRIGRGD